MRAKLILVLATAALAACSDATAPDSSEDGLNPNASAQAPDNPAVSPLGRSGSGGVDGTTTPGDGITPPCLEAVRLASDILDGPVTCRR